MKRKGTDSTSARVGELLATVRAVASERPEAFGTTLDADCNILVCVRPLKCYTLSSSQPSGEPTVQTFVSYLRVSTRKQGASGLGLEAQQAAVGAFVEAAKGRLAREFREVESGGKNDREQLRAALDFARRSKATLLVAKLDRLARNVAFLATLMESGVEFIACDNPHANRFTVHILAAVAEWERSAISKRTKDALAAVKARGKALGSARPGYWEGREDQKDALLARGREKGREATARKAREEYADLLPRIVEMKAEGRSLRQIADALNEAGETTRNGKPFGPVQVQRIIARGGNR